MLRKTMGAVAISAALFAPVMSTTVFAATAASEQQAPQIWLNNSVV